MLWTTTERFELPRAMPNRFLIDRLNHSAKLPNPADSRDRTSDLQIFSLTLSQLSYTGVLHCTPATASWVPGGRLRFAIPRTAGRAASGVPVAKWTRRRFPEPKIVGSNPIWDDFILPHSKKNIFLKKKKLSLEGLEPPIF